MAEVNLKTPIRIIEKDEINLKESAIIVGDTREVIILLALQVLPIGEYVIMVLRIR